MWMEHRKIHRRMMDARYYLRNGVAHPFTTGSSVGRSFRLSRLFLSLSFFQRTCLHLTSIHVSSPLERRSPLVQPVSGIKICRSSRANVAPGGIIHLTRRSRLAALTNACTWRKAKVPRPLDGHPKWKSCELNRYRENGETRWNGERFLVAEVAVSRTLWLENSGIKG